MIDEQEVRLKSDAAVGLLYEMSFGVNYEKDFMNAQKDNSTLVIYRILWTLAKTADDSIPEMMKWLKQFKTIEIDVVGEEAVELFLSSIMTKKKFQQHTKRAAKK